MIVQDMESADKIRKQGIVIPAPIASVDAAIMAYLVDQFGEKACWWRKPPQLDGMAIYAPLDDTGWGRLGYYGEIWLRSLGDQRTNLRATIPDLPSDEETLYYLVGWAYFTDHILHKHPEAESKLNAIVFSEVTNVHQPSDPGFKELLDKVRIRKLGEGQVDLYRLKLDEQDQLLQHILGRLQRDGLLQTDAPAVEELATSARKKSGNPGLRYTDPHEHVTRLAKAWWAVEIRAQNPQMIWDQIALKVGWLPRHRKLLQYARDDLAAAQETNDEILVEVRQLRDEMMALKNKQ